MKFLKKAAALFFCLTLALSVMAITAAADDVTYTIGLTPATARADVNNNSNPDYNMGETGVVYNITLTASADATVNAVEFTFVNTNSLDATVAIMGKTGSDLVTSSVTGGTRYKYEAAANQGESISLQANTAKNIGQITFSTPSSEISAPTLYPLTVKDAKVHNVVGTVGTGVTGTGSVTIEVHPQYTLHFKTYALENGVIKSTPESTTRDVEYNVYRTAAVTVNPPTSLDNYDFNGWTKDSGNVAPWNTDLAVNSTNKTYTIATTDKVYGNATFIADFSATKYNVTYSFDTGEAFDTVPTLTAGTGTNVYQYTITNAYNAFGTAKKDGYTFNGWKASVTGTMGWTNNTTYTASNFAEGLRYGAVTLTPDFSAIAATATFENDLTTGKVGTPAGIPVNADYSAASDLTMPNDPTLTGYTFAGWKVKDAVGSWTTGNTRYGKASDLTNNFPTGQYGDVTFQATWTPVSYSVSFADGQESGTHSAASGLPAASVSYTIEDTAADKFPTSAPTRNGYTFGGWKVTSADGSWTANDVYVIGEIAEGSTNKNFANNSYGNPTLTAQWTKVDYTATFELDGGTLAADAQSTCNYDVETAIVAPGVSRNGYDFAGWKVTTAGGSFVAWLDGSETAQTATQIAYGTTGHAFAAGQYGNVTFTAIWEKASYTVTFLKGDTEDGGVPATISLNLEEGAYKVQYTFGTVDALNAVTITRPGYAFKGWKVTTANGSYGADNVLVVSTSGENAGKGGGFDAQNFGGPTVTAQWEIIGDFKQVSYKFAYSANGTTHMLTLFAAPSDVSGGGYQYDGAAMFTTTRYNSLFTDLTGKTVYAIVAPELTNKAEDYKAKVVYASGVTNSNVDYSGDVNGVSGVDIGDYGTAGAIFREPSRYLDETQLNRLGMDMQNDETLSASFTDDIGTINDIKAIMTAAS